MREKIKLIVDSGSTKADWAMLDQNGKITETHTMGFNPYFHSPEKIQDELSRNEFANIIPAKKIDELHFYGAGCSDHHYVSIMQEGLGRVFTNAKIWVEHDLLGAARATCGSESGICGIMGTGSNSCAYDGTSVVDNITALSHVLGDEGSGVHLGKLLLQKFFYRELSPVTLNRFNQTYPEGGRSIIHRIYGEEGQNVQIAQFAQFVIENKHAPEMQEIIQQAVSEYAKRHLKKYQDCDKLPINLVGSIAGLLENEIRTIFKGEGLSLGRVVRKPLQSLVQYHEKY
jgi:N-acetylglucosamine kinase-like BadF-type ATPase